MTKIPEVPLPVLKNLYEAASDFSALEPWELFEDSELIGIQDPATKQMGYACVLGALGEVFALCVYRGAQGYEIHRRMQNRQIDMEAGDFISVQDCLMAEFADRGELDQADRKAIKDLGLKFRGSKAWPAFRSHLPSYAPWHLTEAEAAFLAFALRCACDATRQVGAEALDLEAKPGQVFCYFPKDAGFETRWESAPVHHPEPARPLALDPEKLAQVKAGRWNPGQIWEVDAFHLPAALDDKDRPYFPLAAMVIHQDSGFIIHSELCGPEKSRHQALADTVLEAVQRSGRMPQEMQVRGEEMARLMAPLGEALGVKVVAKDRLEGVLEAKEGMENHMCPPRRAEPSKSMDRRAMEKVSFNLARQLKEQDFESPEEANRFLHELQERGELEKTPAPESAWEAAQNLMYEAFDEGDMVRRVKLARRALKICPDCADAYSLLAEETAGSLEEERDLYQKAVEAGQRALGEEFFQQNTGHFWGVIESRPYMRARAELARCLWLSGDRDSALGHWRDLLRLNPSDNQGMRYILLARLGGLGRFEEAREIISCYKDDCGLELLLMKVLAAFALQSPSEACAALREAFDYNKHFPAYLLKKKRLPRHMPDRLLMGGDSEAVCAVSELMPAWEKVPGALEWAAGELAKLELPKVGRNDPCPCGSGRKYKKCCAR